MTRRPSYSRAGRRLSDPRKLVCPGVADDRDRREGRAAATKVGNRFLIYSAQVPPHPLNSRKDAGPRREQAGGRAGIERDAVVE